ncbi:MAG: polysaccharide biosynthesis/export family protein [Gammaproteobacteria bacterium]
MKAFFALAPAAFCLFAIAGCSSSPALAQSPNTANTANTGCSTTGSYQIGPGDVLNISVWKNKDLDRVATVLPNGMISFPLVNDVQAAGLTPMQLQNTLNKGLQRYLTHPQVSVVVQKASNTTVSVLGEVNQPGSYPLQVGSTTVLDMLAKAGGLSNFANKGNISVLRKEANGTHRIHFRYYKAISQQPGATDFCVQPGDIVVIH